MKERLNIIITGRTSDWSDRDDDILVSHIIIVSIVFVVLISPSPIDTKEQKTNETWT